MMITRMLRQPKRAVLGLSLLAGGNLCGAALWMPAARAEAAADSAATTLEQVVVSARKRDESMQTVPIAISVLPGELLRGGNLDELNDFVDLIPNATFTQDSGTSTEISIRGSGRNMAEEDPGVGLNKDGVYIGGPLFSTAVLYDLARVEILRGPQAGLYGRNAVGGAVNIITERPGFDHDGQVDLQLGSKDRRELRAAVNVPIVEGRWAIRLAGLFIDQQRGFDRIENQDLYSDAVENNSVRLRSLFRLSDHLEFLTTFEWFERDGGGPLVVLAPNAEFGHLDANATIPYPGTQVEDTLHQQRDLPEYRRLKMWHAIQEVNWQLPKGMLTGIISYRDATFDTQLDEDLTIHRISEITYDAAQESLFAELRFASADAGAFRFLAGVNYLDEDVKLNNRYNIGSNFAGALGGANIARAFELGYFDASWAPLGIAGRPITIFGWTPFATGWSGYLGDTFPADFVNEQTLESFAVFLEADYALTERVKIWGNARYARDEKTIDFAQTYGLPVSRCPIACAQVFGTFLGLPDPEVIANTSETFSIVSPGGGVDFRLSQDVLLYAKIVTGFKAGGFNDIAGRVENLPFDEEKTLSYEIGAKTNWLDDRLRVNVAAFHQTREDALITINDPDMHINSLGVNAGEIENRGVELEITAQPSEGLRLMLAAGYLDAEFTDFVLPRAGGDIIFTGNRVPRTFKYSLSGIATYSRPLTPALSLTMYGSYRNAWDGYINNDNDMKLDQPEIVDLRIGVKNNAWELVGFVDNVFDNRYKSSEFGSVNTTARHRGTFAPGRTYGLQASYQF